MTAIEPISVTVALSTRPGTAGLSGDAAAVHTLADQTAAVAVVDGIGHSERVASVSALLAEVVARVAARRGALAGLLSAGELVADPGADEEPEPDAVAVVAVTDPGDDTTRIAWVGDARAWGWDGTRLRQYSTDQTMGQFLRRVHPDGPPERAHHYDAWVRAALSTAVVATVREAEISDPLVLLTTDGIHDTVNQAELEALVHAHRDPQALADALTAAAREGCNGERDDATAAVLLRSASPG
ncbi:SpoIIE family protein phosphatase [Streptomyces sp. NRRL F-5135]|uniref:SpoIIE family protein phosphatase n=1 Tax=Streptomyces sp. NRRL F-5135 TaxID=1463858 RepID=UPI0004C6D5F4|nr:SpoIIE family protein phosphatase [Streptomyces sp. NRRL F-5135]